MSTAFVFPGQGAQAVGMGRDLYAASAAARGIFDLADAMLGLALTRLCFEGPEEVLTATEHAQPALLTVSAALLATISETRDARRETRDSVLEPAALLSPVSRLASFVAGHSLGEYSALVAAGALSFDDGLRTVRRRGELMAAVGDRVAGGMAAILNLSPEIVAEICREASEAGRVEVANYNSPEQTVISGELTGVERAMALAKERGAKRAVKLNVSAPFHSSLMAPLAEEMSDVLAALPVRSPEIPVIANVTADYVRTPDEVRDALTRQVAGSVRWTETVRRLADDGVTATVEAGPGRVLTGLTPRIVAGMTAQDSVEGLACLLGE